MAYDGLITYGISLELERRLVPGKIEKVYQPAADALVLQIHGPEGNLRLFVSCGSETARVAVTDLKYRNPDVPPNFCMLLRKHIQSGRITGIRQYGSERIIEFDIESLSELGFAVNKRLIVEIMGKHSNIVLTDAETGRIIDCIKHISIDVNRYRQLLPGIIYRYPPAQDKRPFKEVTEDMLLTRDAKLIMGRVAGISPALAREMAGSSDPAARLAEAVKALEAGKGTAESAPRVYMDGDTPREFHITELSEYAGLDVLTFPTISECVEFFYQNRAASNTIRMKAQPLLRSIRTQLDKALLKKQRIGEDILRAEDSDKYRLYGELLTANLHLVRPGARSVTVTSYYDGSSVTIPLDEKFAASKNAQNYYKKYAKARTALKEKSGQLRETEDDIRYLESVLQSAESADTEEALDAIREELIETGYMRNRSRGNQRKKKAARPQPLKYTLSDGSTLLVGRNNIENDYISTKASDRGDLWFHTKDIPGSHCVLIMEKRSVEDLPERIIYEAAQAAAWHSKGRSSENVPVDFTLIKYVKKPSGAKPGMVIFTHNTTVYVTPKLPQ